ncbi:MAG: hypothetical protein JSS27_07655 [Planctomycetes bacterium]|nr:hypothetical protein [Planctomycetota bacterium]
MPTSRRRLLQSAAGASLLGLADLSPFRPFGEIVARAAESTADVRKPVRFGNDIEPIVRLLETTPREQCFPALVEQLRGGLPYDRFLAAVFLAAVRKNNAGHDVYKMISVHQTCQAVRPEEKLLPLFWAVDVFKVHQADFPSEPLAEMTGALPAPERAAADFDAAVAKLDVDGAERAVIALVRGGRTRELIESMWQLAIRNGGIGGHGAILISNCFRTLEVIGWQEPEAALRFAIQDLFRLYSRLLPDGTYAPNAARVEKHFDTLPHDWAGGGVNRAATLAMLELMRTGKPHEACELAIQQLHDGVGATAIWDAAHLGAGELMVRHDTGWGVASRPVHSNTSLNAIHFAFRTTTSDRARLLMLLQGVGWTAEKTRADGASKWLRDIELVHLPEASVPESNEEAVGEIFSLLPERWYSWDAKTSQGTTTYGERADADLACRKMFHLTSRRPEAAALFMQQARSWLCQKTTTDTHDFKLQAAILEDAERISPIWRPYLLASSIHFFHGKQSRDYPTVEQARDAVRKLS